MFRRFFWVSVGADTWMWTSRWTQEQIYCFERSYSWKNVNEMLTCWWDILGSAMLPCRNLSKKSCEVPVACWNNVGNSSGTSCQVCNCPLRWNLTSSSRIEAILFVYARRKVLRLPCIVHFDMQTVSKVTFKPSSCITYIYIYMTIAVELTWGPFCFASGRFGQKVRYGWKTLARTLEFTLLFKSL